MHRRQGFTIVEMLIAVGLLAILLAVAAPSFSDYVLTQRLKAANAQLLTDMQFARSEAMSRGKQVFVQFRVGSSTSMSCYTIYVDPSDAPDRCDCTQPPGTACPTGTRELRTVQLPSSQGVRLTLPDGQDTSFSFSPVSGGIFFIPGDEDGWTIDPYRLGMVVDSKRQFSNTITLGGLPKVCLPSGASLSGGYPTC